MYEEKPRWKKTPEKRRKAREVLVGPRMAFRVPMKPVREAGQIREVPKELEEPSRFKPHELKQEQYRGWIKVYLGKGRYKFFLRPDLYTSNQFTLTSGTDDIDLILPFNARIQKVVLSFNDATTRALSIYHLDAMMVLPTYPLRYFYDPDDTSTDEIIFLEENENEFAEGDTLRIRLVGTAAKTVAPKIYLQRVPE